MKEIYEKGGMLNKRDWVEYYRECRIEAKEAAVEKFKDYPEAREVIAYFPVLRDFTANTNAYDFMFNDYFDIIVERS